MPSQPPPNVRETCRRPCGVGSGGFTLIEMIGVFAVLMIIAGIIFGIVPGALRQASVDKAEAELQVIQHALETYRARFGEYPRPPSAYQDEGGASLYAVSDDPEYLAGALNGLLDPLHQPVNVPPMINNSVLTYEKPGLPRAGENGSVMTNRILDPWGRPYVYQSAKPVAGVSQAFGYELFSFGPDGQPGSPDDVRAR